MKSYRIAGIALAVLLLIGLIWMVFGAREEVKLSGATLNRIHMTAPTDGGYLALAFGSTAESPRFVNVYVDLNGDGAFAEYAADGGAQAEHLVLDFPVSVAGGSAASYPVSIPDRAIDGRENLRGVAVFSAQPASSTSPDSPKGAQAIEFKIAKPGVQDFSDSMNLGVNDGRRRGIGAGGRLVSVANAVTPQAERPYEYIAKVDGLGDPNQNYNECAPTSVSNNIRWLAKKYKFEDKIPADERQLINELKGDLLWDDGVRDEDFVAGKNAFFARRGIPIVTHQIGGKNDIDIHWLIYEEIKKGQAIELGVSFFGEDGRPAGGHAVAVESVYRMGGKDYIALRDSATRSDKPTSEYYEMQGDMIMDYGGTAYIDYAWAQSPTDELAAGTFADPRDDRANHVIRAGETLAEAGGDVTRAIGKFGFFYVDIEHPGDHLVGESFPVRATVIKRPTVQEMGYWVEEVRNVFRYSAADPWTLGGTFTSLDRPVAPTNKFDSPRNGRITGTRHQAEAVFTCTSAGPARVSYTAELAWTRNAEPPAQLLPRYAAQLEPKDRIVVESPVFLCKSSSTLPEEPKAALMPLCPGIDEDPEGVEFDVLKKANECYPAVQFHTAGPDQCDAEHWHATRGAAQSLSGRVWSDPSGCGFGKTSEVGGGKIRLSPDQAAPFADFIR